MNQLEAEAKHFQDQAWAHLRERESDIKRIAGGGLTTSEHDAACVRMVFQITIGDMCLRASEAMDGA